MSMNKKERGFLIEMIVAFAAGLMLAFALPTLASQRDSFVAVLGIFLGLLWLGWVFWLVIRMADLTKN